MNYLDKYNFSKKFYNDLVNTYDQSIIDIFRFNEDLSLIIDYFLEIGIKDIEGLILYKIEIFTNDIDTVKDAFNKFNIEELVKEINEDISFIDKV
jgi:hypothetical protein